ncbi:TolC family protein [Leptobacterium flavescens]|uniref:TolC family protein n=1 Tax=Leptobacterium flavescens TaxID=472055 RepID=A0A6P0UPB9_9FLAO|nr:TolC family protein [Leptobacterium flavescens]NER14837.1 TolC family protein [Leptobacterium flavescens]
MSYTKRLIAFAGVLLSFGPLMAQELLTKEKATQQVLENNLGIKIAENSAEIAANNAGVLNSGYLPSLTGNAGANYDRQNIEAQLTNGEERSSDGVETRRYNASVNLNYTLFDGLGRYYNYKSLKEQSDLSELEARETIETTILQLFTVYYEVARLSENYDNLQETLKISKDRLKRAEYQFEYGQNTRLDFLNAQVDVNTDSINVLNARQTLQNAKRDLNLIMNRELSIAFEVDTLVTFVPNLLMEDMVSQAMQKNVTLLQIEKGLKINNYNYKSIKGNYLPTIGLTGSYGWNESNNNNPAAFTIQNTSYGLSAGISLSWSIFDGGRTITSAKNAKLTYQNQELLKEQTEKQVERDIRNAWESYKNALFVLEAQKENEITNRNNFNRTEERYKIGQATSIEFRQAQLNLLNAIVAKNQAKYTAKLAELQVLQVSGELLNTDF